MARIESEFTIKDLATPILDRIAKQAEQSGQRMERAMKLTSSAGRSAMKGFSELGSAFKMNMVGIDGMSTAMSGFKNLGSAAFQALKGGAEAFTAALGPIYIILTIIVEVIKKVAQAIPNAIQKITDGVKALYSQLTTAYNVLSKLYSFGDQQRGMEFRIAVFADGINNTNEIRDSLTQAALESFSSLEDISSLTSGIMISGATGGNVDRSVQLAENISKAMVATGATSEEASRSVLQLKQALSSGVLQGDELRSIREQTPGVMLALASGIRKMAEAGEIESKYANVAMGDLKQMGADGVLTADVVVRAFEEGADDIDAIFNQMPITFERIATTIKTVFQSMWARITDPSTVFGQMVRKALATVQKLGEAFTNASAEVNAFFKGFNEGMAPIYAGFVAIDNALNNLTNAFGRGEEALGKWQTAGQVAGTVMTAVIGLIVAKMAMLAISTIAAAWPILLIAGAFLGVAAIMSYVSEGAVTLGGVFTAVGQIVVGTIMAIAEVGLAVWGVIQTIYYAIKGTVEGLVSGFYGLASGFVGLIGTLCSAVGDLVNTAANMIADFLTPIADLLSLAGVEVDLSGLRGVGSDWGSGLLTTAEDLFNTGIDWGESSLESYGDIGSAWQETAGNMGSVADWGVSNIQDMPNKVDDLLDTVDGFSSLIGQDVNGMFGDFFGDTTNALDNIGNNTGDTASNTANKEVSLSDQDIEYLKSIAARDFMVNVNTAAPTVNNSFGDVRETADVDGILDAITGMVEDQLAVTLVG